MWLPSTMAPIGIYYSVSNAYPQISNESFISFVRFFFSKVNPQSRDALTTQRLVKRWL